MRLLQNVSRFAIYFLLYVQDDCLNNAPYDCDKLPPSVSGAGFVQVRKDP